MFDLVLTVVFWASCMVYLRYPPPHRGFFLMMSVFSTVYAVAAFGLGRHAECGFAAGMTLWFLYKWWKNGPRGRGRKALKDLGAKSKARIAALVEKMTPSPIPDTA